MTALAQLVNQRQPVAFREHDVDHRDVIRLPERRIQPGFAIRKTIHRKASLAQPALYKSRDGVVILDEKSPHA